MTRLTAQDPRGHRGWLVPRGKRGWPARADRPGRETRRCLAHCLRVPRQPPWRGPTVDRHRRRRHA
eukprot:1458253-Lingulodinium_polyedra.AAC.1